MVPAIIPLGRASLNRQPEVPRRSPARSRSAWPRVALTAALGLAAAFLGGCGGGDDSAASRLPGKPNVVILLADALRADRLPAYGYPRPTAPFLSQLAADSVLFKQADSHTSWTAPSVATLFTSLFPEQHGVRQGLVVSRGMGLDFVPLPTAIPTLAEAFRDVGYQTIGFGSNPNLRRETGLTRGFDMYVDLERVRPRPDYNPAKDIAEAVEAWFETRDAGNDAPYFLFLHFMDPHAPYNDHANLPPPHPADENSARYDSEIRYMDDFIRQLYETCGWDRDTLLVFLGDHGEELGERGDYGHGETLYEEVVHVPFFFHSSLLARSPGVVETPVGLIDLFPTLAELLSLPVPAHAQGVSLAPVLMGEAGTEPPHRLLYGSLFRPWKADDPVSGGEMRALRDGNWRLIKTGDRLELYNLQNDPRQIHDLVTAESDLADALSRTLREIEDGFYSVRFDAETHSIEINENEKRKMKSLGYAR